VIVRRVAVLSALLVCVLANEVAAQPYGWVANSSTLFLPSVPASARSIVSVVNLATGAGVAIFDVPPGIAIGAGALTPDGRYYLVPTSVGIARFIANSPAFDRMLAPGISVAAIAIAPAGRRLYATGAFGRAVLDWETGLLERVDCCTQPRSSFTPDGTVRIELTGGTPTTSAVTITALNEATGARLWEWTGPAGSGAGPVAVSNAYVAVPVGPSLIVLDVIAGAEVGSTAVTAFTATGLAWRGDSLLVSRDVQIDVLTTRHRLSAFSVPALAETVIVEEDRLGSAGGSRGVTVSSDGRYAYWRIFVSVLGLTVSSTQYRVVDLDTFRVVGTGSLSGQGLTNVAIEQAPQCLFSGPTAVMAPASGGVVGVAVEPGPGCRPWSVTDDSVLNPGPHDGPATILANTWAHGFRQPYQRVVSIGGRLVTITQPAGVPAAPTLEAAVEGDRVRLTWIPGFGSGITSFQIRGAVLGSPTTPVASVGASLRTWTSPPLGPGSYALEIAAANDGGLGPVSNLVTFSIGVVSRPEAPIGFAAIVVDNRVAFAWQPGATGPAPSGYIVEAAAEGAATFAEVARTSGASLVVARAPIGNWQARVRAITAGGAGLSSAPVSFTTSTCTLPPAPPQQPWSLWTPPAFTVQWASPLAGSVDDYVLEIGSTSGGADLGRIVVPGDRLSVTQAVASIRAFVRIRARNACGESAPSAEVVVSTR